MTLLRDPQRQQEFESRGYTVLPFLDESEIARLAALYASMKAESTSHRMFSVGHDRPALIRLLRDAFEEIASGALARHLVPYDLLLGNFLVKPPHPEGVVPPHQDWTILDNKGDSGGTIWIPLAGVDLEMGALGVLPGSHRLFSDLRYAPSAQGYRLLPYADYAMDLFPYLDLLSLSPGEAVVFHSDVIHGSLPNLSDQARVAAIFGVVAKGSRLSLHYLLPATGLSQFESFDFARDDFLKYHNSELSAMFARGAKPSGLATRGIFDVRRTQLSSHDAIALIEATGCRRHGLPS